MATAFITPDQDGIVSEIEISAPPERVFRALTTREDALRWWENPTYELTVWEMDARLGGQYRFTARVRAGKNAGKEYKHHGEITEFDPPRVLAYTWMTNFHDDPSRETVVRWELTPKGKATHVKITHSGLLHEPTSRKGYSEGWLGLLRALKTLLEK